MDKKLLRKIKHGEFIEEEYDNEMLDNALIAEYNAAHTTPMSEWTNNQLFTRMCELYYMSYKLHTLFPDYYNYNWEFYDIQDEIDNRYSSYYHHNHEQDY